VGFRGYFGGFEAICVISDKEFASTWGAMVAFEIRNEKQCDQTQQL
jgi:hypothetical protein